VSRQEAPERCVGCSLRFPASALDEAGLCEDCEDEAELEINDDLDDARN